MKIALKNKVSLTILFLLTTPLLAFAQSADLSERLAKIETANAKRLSNLVKLAKLRNVSLEKTMSDLGIFPVEI